MNKIITLALLSLVSLQVYSSNEEQKPTVPTEAAAAVAVEPSDLLAKAIQDLALRLRTQLEESDTVASKLIAASKEIELHGIGITEDAKAQIDWAKNHKSPSSVKATQELSSQLESVIR